MAHSSLVPVDGVYLTNGEVVRRLREEFSFVATDQELGLQEYDKGLEYLRSLLEKGLSPGGRDIAKELAVAEDSREEVLYVSIADSSEPADAYISTTLVPGEPIFFGYCSKAHQDAAMPLLERVKMALGYHDNEQ